MIEQLKKSWRDKDEGGFTLIELLVVIVILGILAAVVVFAVAGVTDRGQESACDADRRTVETAQEAYFAQNNDYAASTTVLATAGFLNGVSDMHTTTADNTTTPKSYSITEIGDCD